MAKEDNIILPVAAGLGLLLLLSDSGPGPGPAKPGPAGITPTTFIKQYWPEAVADYRRTGINPIFTLTQGGFESGWGKHAPRFNYFGVKADSKWKGERQLLDTTEYYKGQPVKIKDWFRAYPSAAAGFYDHSKFFFDNPRYSNALKVRGSAVEFAKAITAAGYATDPGYLKGLLASMEIVVQVLQRHNLI